MPLEHYTDDDVALFVRGDRRCIIKAHGTVENPVNIIFTRKDYAVARYAYASFYTILDALALTHTFLFVGCGLADPDVQLLLERYAHVFPGGRTHYMVSPRGGVHADVLTAVRRNMNLKILTYKPDDHHDELRNSIADLVDRVEGRRDQLIDRRDW